MPLTWLKNNWSDAETWNISLVICHQSTVKTCDNHKLLDVFRSWDSACLMWTLYISELNKFQSFGLNRFHSGASGVSPWNWLIDEKDDRSLTLVEQMDLLSRCDITQGVHVGCPTTGRSKNPLIDRILFTRWKWCCIFNLHRYFSNNANSFSARIPACFRYFPWSYASVLVPSLFTHSFIFEQTVNTQTLMLTGWFQFPQTGTRYQTKIILNQGVWKILVIIIWLLRFLWDTYDCMKSGFDSYCWYFNPFMKDIREQVRLSEHFLYLVFFCSKICTLVFPLHSSNLYFLSVPLLKAIISWSPRSAHLLYLSLLWQWLWITDFLSVFSSKVVFIGKKRGIRPLYISLDTMLMLIIEKFLEKLNPSNPTLLIHAIVKTNEVT